MGSWGPGIFDDDTSCDVRSHYRSALRAGVPGPQVTDQSLRDYAPALIPSTLRSGWALPPPSRGWAGWRQDTTLQPGQHLLFRFTDGQRVLLRVLDVQEFSLEATEGTLPVVMLLDWWAGQPLPAGPALDHVPNALRWGALWFRAIHKGPRDGVPNRIQVLPGRWSEAPSWRGFNGSLIYTWDELQSQVPW